MAKRPAKQRSHKRARFIIAKPEDIETVEQLLNADRVQEDCEHPPSLCTAGPLDNMPDGDEDDEDEGDVMGDGD